MPPDAHEAEHAARQLRKDLFISALALISVAIGAWDLFHPRAHAGWTWLDILDLAIVAIFIVDFALSAARSGDGWRYVRRHWYELPALIPITGNMTVGAEAVPFLRGLRLVRLVRVARLLRVIGALARIRAVRRKVRRIIVKAHIGGLVLFAAFATLAGAAAAWWLEAPHNERFQTPYDALWWALNMFSNVAYVDFQPATAGGRFVAAILEFTGIAFIGLFTASLAGALLTDKEEDHKRAPTRPLD